MERFQRDQISLTVRCDYSPAATWRTLNDDILNIIFDTLHEMQPANLSSYHLDRNYTARFDIPWTSESSIKTLKECTLVSHQWKMFARHRLFRCIRIDLDHQLDYFASWIDSNPTKALPFVILDLRTIFPSTQTLKLLSNSPGLKYLILRYIDEQWNNTLSTFNITNLIGLQSMTSLYISILPRIVEVKGFAEIRQLKLTYPCFYRIISAAHHLEALSINTSFIDTLDKGTIESETSHYSKISTLEIIYDEEDPDIGRFDQYNSLLSGVSELCSLRVYDLLPIQRFRRSTVARGFPSIPSEKLSTLTNLSIRRNTSQSQLQHLFRSCSRLQTLSAVVDCLDESVPPSVDACERFLKDVPRTLISLRLLDSTAQRYIIDALSNSLEQVGSFPCLEALTLDFTSDLTNNESSLRFASNLYNHIPKLCKERNIRFCVLIDGKPRAVNDRTIIGCFPLRT